MNWPLVPLGKLAEIVGGSTPRREVGGNWGPGHYWATPTDLPMPGDAILDLQRTSQTITDEGLRSCSTNLLPIGTVLYSTRATIGKIAISNVPVATNQGFNNLICGSEIFNRYLAYALQYFTPDISSLAGSTTFKEVSRSSLRGFKIPLPTIREQYRIAEIIEAADKIRQERRALDTTATRILPLLFTKMFGDTATNSMKWEMTTLGDLADHRPEYGANASSCSQKVDMPRYVRITDIQDNGTLSEKEVVSLEMSNWQRYILCEGDVLFARSGNTVGKTYIYRPADGPCAFAGYLIRFKFRSGAVDPWFIFGLTQTSYYRSWVESHKRVAGQPNINAQEYSSIMVPQPPMHLQHKFRKLAQDLELTLKNAGEAAHQFDTTFATLLNRAFTSQLTAKWRQMHMLDLLDDMAQQAKFLNFPGSNAMETLI